MPKKIPNRAIPRRGPGRPAPPAAKPSQSNTAPSVRTAQWTPPDPLPSPLPAPPAFLQDAASIGVQFDEGEVEKLGAYLALLLDANKTFNLTAVRDPEEAWRRHILDSLTLLAPLSELPEGASVIDVGSGGGLPGIPLAIARPDLKITLREATGKKAEFLRLAASALRLSNVFILADRAERAAHDRGTRTAQGGREGGHREKYDAAVARAVGPLAVITELTTPFVRKGGHALLIKGEKAQAELEEGEQALRMLGAVYVDTMETPTGRIIILEKGTATPRDYPRRDGEPARSPLGMSRQARPAGKRSK